MSTLTYIMTCGCKLNKSNLIIPPKTHTRNGCPTHPDGRTDHRILVCDCKTKIKLSKSGNPPRSCPTCAAKKLKASQGRANKKNTQRRTADRVYRKVKKHGITYTMLCGCTLQREELAHIRLKLICPKHLEGIAHKNYICVKCGELCTASKMVREPKYCDSCAKKTAIERARLQTAKNYNRPIINYDLVKKSKHAATLTYNCPHRERCLDEAHELAKYLPCYGCDEYPMAIALSQIRVHGGDYERRVSA